MRNYYTGWLDDEDRVHINTMPKPGASLKVMLKVESREIGLGLFMSAEQLDQLLLDATAAQHRLLTEEPA